MKQLSHCDLILDYFRAHNHQTTLGELLDAGKYTFSHKLTARMSDLRKKGYEILFEKGDNPTNNIYRLIDKEMNDTTNVVKYYYDEFSQGAFL